MSKRTAAVSLAISILLISSYAFVFFGASGAEDNGNDIREKTLGMHLDEVPYGYTGIYDFNDLMDINGDLSGSYILMSDITFELEDNAIFKPIGSFAEPFTGVFDGNGYKIIGLQLTVEEGELNDESIIVLLAGLFGSVEGATISNLGVTDSTIEAITTTADERVQAGGIVAHADSSTIENCYFDGSVTTSSVSFVIAGGIAGWAAETQITSCQNMGDITVTSTTISVYAGGIAGIVAGSMIQNCHNTGSVKATATDVIEGNVYFEGASAAGIAGYAFMQEIDNCYNTGEITANSDKRAAAAGIANNFLFDLIITNCYNTGEITAEGDVAAFAGGIVNSVVFQADIENCYNTGEIKAISPAVAFAGGIAGILGTGHVYSSSVVAGETNGTLNTVKNCYNIAPVSTEADAEFAGSIAGAVNVVTVSYVPSSPDLYAYVSVIDGVITELYLYHGDIEEYEEYIIDNMTGVTTISHCYFLGEPSDKMIGYPEDASLVVDDGDADEGQMSGAKTEGQLTKTPSKTGSAYYSDDGEGWDFDDVWTIVPEKNGGYPILQSLAASVPADTDGAKTFTVTLPSGGTGYTVSTTDPLTDLLADDTVSFTVTVSNGYDEATLTVKIKDGAVLVPATVSGKVFTFTIEVNDDVEIEISVEPAVEFSADGTTLEKYPEDRTETSYEIPSTVETIAAGAFAGSGLESISIPSSVTEIGAGAFADCDGLETITLPSTFADADLEIMGIPEGTIVIFFSVSDSESGSTLGAAPDPLLSVLASLNGNIVELFLKNIPAGKNVSVTATDAGGNSIGTSGSDDSWSFTNPTGNEIVNLTITLSDIPEDKGSDANILIVIGIVAITALAIIGAVFIIKK